MSAPVQESPKNRLKIPARKAGVPEACSKSCFYKNFHPAKALILVYSGSDLQHIRGVRGIATPSFRRHLLKVYRPVARSGQSYDRVKSFWPEQ